jgi:hypothetical protein
MSKTLKFGIYLLILLSVLLGVVLAIDIVIKETVTGSAINTETPVLEPQEDQTLDEDVLAEAVKAALSTGTGRWQAFTYDIDHIQVQDDGQMAIVWLAAIDPESGELFAREPELAIARKNTFGQWEVLLEDDESFDLTFKSFQYAEKSILDGELLTGEQEALPKSTKVFGGYYLPWAAGLEKRLTWSVGHTSCYPIYYCTHAFDFADGTMFPIVATKGGTVFHWRDTCANGDSSCTNSITIQDKSTTPWTYQIYLHIAQGSVPDNLRQVGTPVMQGQYIANVDDTGYSSGHHVHFMVVTEDTRYFSIGMQSVWGVAEDITFRDVDINWDEATQGGRPRLAYEAATYGGEGRTYYISGNLPANPPTGGLSQPVTKTYQTNPVMTVTGWGNDDVSVTKAEILANYDGNWVTIGEAPGGTSFTTNIDLCKTTVPDGPFKLAVRVWDYEGNPSAISGKRELIKNVQCGTAGIEPSVEIKSLYLPENGFVEANVQKGSTGSAVTAVDFWFNTSSWNQNTWVHLGKDTNGTDGWGAPISTASLAERSDYTLMAVATDSAGNQGADVRFDAIVDRTEPFVKINQVPSPVMGDSVTVTWTGGDELSGLDHYSLSVKINDGNYQVLDDNIPPTTTSFTFDVEPNQLIVVSVTAVDKVGGEYGQKSVMYTDGYEWPYQYLLFPVYNGY